jgi:osmotically-inducible protein OsmY
MSDRTLLQDVRTALRWDPRITSPDIAAAVYGGIVTLRGGVGTYREREDATAVARQVVGVKGVVNELAVHLAEADRRPDREIAFEAARALKLNTAVPSARLLVSVGDGHLTLTGSVDWLFERQTALATIRNLPGLVGITDAIVVLQPHVKVA